MKLDKIFAALFIGLAMTACSNDDEMTTGGQGQSPVTGGTAYMSVALNMPKSTGTRAPGLDYGSSEEQKVNTVMIVLFDASDICVEAKTLAASEYKLTVGSTASADGEAFQVPATTKKALVVINPNTNFKNRCVVSAGWAAINAALATSVEDVIGTTKDNFMMINAGDATTHKALIDVSSYIKTVGAAGYANATDAQVAAKTSPATINVERVVAKVSLNLNGGGVEIKAPGATCTFGNWALNVTNKYMFPFSEIVEPVAGSDMSVNYRKDNNYDAGSFNKSKFNYLDAAVSFSNMTEALYCLENTMDAAEQKEAQTTSAVVSAVYTPAGYDANKSWFRLLGTSYKTLADLQAVYTTAKTAVTDGSASDLQKQQKTLCDEFYVRIAAMATAQGKTWNASDFASLDIDEMNAIDNGGEASKPAVVSDPIDPVNNPDIVQDLGVEYFQKGACYYSILIRHDDAVTGTMELGKYGVVRNNWYTLTINSVKQPGTSWIPDPTNPIDPTDPGEDNDEAESFLAVGITVNGWTTWSQGVEL